MVVIPVSAQFEIDEGCTHRCSHCYNGFFPDIRKSNPTNDGVSRAVAKSGPFFITLTGGEPLLSKKQLYSSIDILKNEQVDFSLNSNLHLLKKEDAKILKKKDVKGVLTSILGPKEKVHDKIVRKSGAFKKLMKSIEYLCNEDVWISANMVVTNENFGYIYDTGRMLHKTFGIKTFCATPIVPSSKHTKKTILTREQYIHTLDILINLSNEFGMTAEPIHPTIPCIFDKSDREKYKRFFESRSCAAVTGTLGISRNGDVGVCSHEKNVYGNVVEEPLDSIIQRMNSWFDRSLIPKECKPCSYVSKCRGGCRAVSEAINGSLNSFHPYFRRPIKEKPTVSKNIDLKNLKVTKDNIKYRENYDGSYTIYANLRSHITTDNFGLVIFRRYMSRKTFDEIKNEVGDKIPDFVRWTKTFAKRKLLV